MTQVQHGLYQFMALGIPAEKLVLGMDWGGAAWECMNYVGDPGLDYCEAELMTTLNGYRGVNCTDDVANGCDDLWHCWQMLTAPTTVHHGWDDYVKLPYFNFAPKNSSKLYQVWYESPESIGHKVSMAKQMQIGTQVYETVCMGGRWVCAHACACSPCASVPRVHADHSSHRAT